MKFIVFSARYGHFTVDPNIDPDPKIDLYFDPNIFVFVLFNVDFIKPLFGFFAKQHFLHFENLPFKSSKTQLI
jgi:hypothetical protein